MRRPNDVSREKLQLPTVFHVVSAGYWDKFSISNNRVSDKPHWLRYRLCAKISIYRNATSYRMRSRGIKCHIPDSFQWNAAKVFNRNWRTWRISLSSCYCVVNYLVNDILSVWNTVQDAINAKDFWVKPWLISIHVHWVWSTNHERPPRELNFVVVVDRWKH